MVYQFAERLVRGDEEALRVAYAEGQEGMFLVDWREADEDIIRLAAEALNTDALGADWRDGQLHIVYQGRSIHVPLHFQPGEQAITLATLNAALAPQHEIRRVRASEGDDTTAYLVLDAADWARLEATHGETLLEAFGLLDPDPQPETQPSPAALAQAAPWLARSPIQGALPQLRLRRHGDVLVAQAMAANEPVPAVVPTFGEFVLTYLGGTAQDPKLVTQAEVAQSGLSHDAMLQIARDHALSGAQSAGSFTDPTQTIFELRGEGTFAAGVALMPEFVDAFAAEVGGILVAAFPNENCFAYTNGDDPECVQRMIDSLATMDFSGPEALSDQLYDWTAEGWVVRPR